MTTEIPKQYEPAAAEAKWTPFWEERGDCDANPPLPGDPTPKPPHVIMIPLPNVTGALHMGHALNGTLQDLLTRWRRMQGYEALWMPGTDHAGIATQSVVEKRMLEEEGLTRHDIGREALVKRIWNWKDSYEKRILSQLKSLGASCDWRRVRFTLDEVCSRAVRQTFFKMFKDGLIYRGKRLVNWDTYLQTAVADDEVYDEEIDGHFWTMNYPVVDEAGQPTGERISFSTTRPETMLGDTAVCVHPTDERYTHLIGKRVRIPLNGRLIPIVADGLLADKTLGTGCVKVTPAHDPNDYACWSRNKDTMGEPINILNPDGTLNEQGGIWQGQDRLAARQAVVAEMEKLGHFEKVEDRKIPMKHSDRSKTPIEPYLSEQWFVKMDTLAQAAIDVVNQNRVTFYPERYRTSYLDWLAEKRDWCISRQLWWGHRIPIWSKTYSKDEFEKAFPEGYRFDSELEQAPWFHGAVSFDDANYAIRVCFDEGHRDIEQRFEQDGFTQEEDVLDTWFSSALWPHATLGWPDREHNPPLIGEASQPDSGRNEVLPYFYPGSVLVTSRDIITLWVARMVLTGLYNMGDIPFKHVCIHPKIQDGFGQTMSKSKGNGVDPLELIEKYGCDGMRFTIASFAGETQDVRLPVGYECPHCQGVIPQEQHHLKFKPGKPRIKCVKCKKESQYATPNYVPDEGEPVARIVIERFEYGRNFCNKLWNAARFAMLNLEGYVAGVVDLSTPDTGLANDSSEAENGLAIEDRWILSRLATVTDELTSLLSIYKFDAATRSLRDFVWNEFCDWYLEMIKPRLRDEQRKPTAQRVLVAVLDTTLRLLHPFTPFITEELWQRLREIAPTRGLPVPAPVSDAIIVAPWPTGLEALRDPILESRFQRLQELIMAVRNVRGTYNISPAIAVSISVRCSQEIARDLAQVKPQFEMLAKATLTAAGPEVTRPNASASFSLGDADGYLPLEGLVDLQAEVARLGKEADKLRGFISGHQKKLSNASFVDRAPAEVVNEVRETLAGLQKQLRSLEEAIQQLSASN
ncbi:valine--tRNA ligase [Schlesneria sp. DSM 10557]|uniref:valine--tRNA ligase n=1 Tax=Schlesneria sp. DSM 10557 TaxID=3044399 RepID=UPI0035A037D6